MAEMNQRRSGLSLFPFDKPNRLRYEKNNYQFLYSETYKITIRSLNGSPETNDLFLDIEQLEIIIRRSHRQVWI